MVSSVVTSLPLLAQMDTLGDFLNQVRGLIAFICVLGVLWIVTFVITLQRNAERRRREKLGLEPLPGIWVSAQQWLKGEGEKQKHDVPSFRTDPAPDALDPGLAPDLDLLTGNLDDEPAPRAPASPPPAAAPPPPKTPVTPVPSPSANLLEDAFTFDDDLPKVAAAPVAAAPVPGTPPPPDSAELLRVFRDLAEGSLVLQIDGQRFNSVSDLVAAGLSRRFTKVVRDLALLVRAVKESAADAAAVSSPARADDLPPDLVELLRVFRDLSEGSLIIEVDGQRFGEVDDLVAAGLSRRFTKVVRDLALLVREAQKIEAESPPPAQPPAPPAPPPPAAQAPRQPPPRPISGPLIPLPDDEMPSMNPGTMLRQMTRAAMGRKPDTPAEEASPPPLSIAEQIDQLLQARLQHMPEYRGRKITVQPSLSGGVQIRVDDTYYEGVGDVAEDDVRTLLQDVVREWEERYS